MWIKQLTVKDWIELFQKDERTLDQVDLILNAQKRRPLATYEENCLAAYEQYTKEEAA